jgi:NADH-quinone oxidoreductase subunit N
MTAGAFLCVLRMRDAQGNPLESLDNLAGLSQSQPLLAIAFTLFVFSLAGIPPLFGFWPKLLVFSAAVDAGLVALAVAAAVGTVVGAYYYLRLVKIMFIDAPAAPFGRRSAPVEWALIAIGGLIVSPLGYLLIGPLGTLSDRAAGSIF